MTIMGLGLMMLKFNYFPENYLLNHANHCMMCLLTFFFYSKYIFRNNLYDQPEIIQTAKAFCRERIIRFYLSISGLSQLIVSVFVV